MGLHPVDLQKKICFASIYVIGVTAVCEKSDNFTTAKGAVAPQSARRPSQQNAIKTNPNANKMLRKIRLTLAILFFGLLTLLFLDFTGALHAWLSWMATIQFLPAVLALHVGAVAAWIVITLLLGRIYCSVVCPLGVMQDIVSWLSGLRDKGRKRRRFSYSPARPWLRYGVLVAFVVALVAGLGSLAALVAPYSAYGRIAQTLLQPLYILANNGLAYLAERADSYAFYSREVWLRSLPTLVVAAVTFVVLAVLAWRGGRTYCNTICPVGTVLSLFARHAWFRVHIDEHRCVGCGLCAKGCKASCIDVKHHAVDLSRCVACGDCIDACHKGAITFGHPKAQPAAEQPTAEQLATSQPTRASASDQTVDSGRRSFLLGSALAVSTAALAQEKKKVDGGLAAVTQKDAPKRVTPITPPGSLSAQHMAQHCTACQLCVSQCPNDVLRPSTHLQTLMQPTMSYERGYCRPECHRCGDVCPTGAIRPIQAADKSSIQIGHAVWSKTNCIVFTDGAECGNCARHCPAGAILMVPTDPDDENSVRFPAVNISRCIGCGACENLCPAKPFSAIHVEGHEVHKYI